MERRRPHVSRETRLLLTVVLISVTSLWVLARVRFPDRPSTPNPMPPVLAQLSPLSPLDAIALSIRDLEARILPALTTIEGGELSGEAPSASRPARIALRFREGFALTIAPETDLPEVADGSIQGMVASDRGNGLHVLSVAPAMTPAVPRWSPARRPVPRFLVAAAGTPEGIVLRPVFVGSLHSLSTPAWPGDVWALPAGTNLNPGSFLFTPDGAWAGVVVEAASRAALVPADTVLSAAEALTDGGESTGGQLGIVVQPLTPEVGAAVGATRGVIVAWVDPDGPAGAKIDATDVVEQLNDRPLDTWEHWKVAAARVRAGETVRLKVRQRGEVRDVPVTAAPVTKSGDHQTSGLTLATRSGLGAEVVRVEAGSASDRAGFEPGDLITQLGQTAAPTAQQVTRALAALPRDRTIVAVVRRADAYRVLALKRTW